MGLNLSALMTGAGAVAKQPVTKGGALAALVTGGLYMASAAGVVVPGWAFVAGPIFGTMLYKFLPAKDQAEIDDVAAKVTDTFETIPTTYPEYPGDKPLPSVVTNLKTKDGSDVGQS
jgi:hypothetical protein